MRILAWATSFAAIIAIFALSAAVAEAGEQKLRVCGTTRVVKTEPFAAEEHVLIRFWANGRELDSKALPGGRAIEFSGRGVLAHVAWARQKMAPVTWRVANVNRRCSSVRLTWRKLPA